MCARTSFFLAFPGAGAESPQFSSGICHSLSGLAWHFWKAMLWLGEGLWKHIDAVALSPSLLHREGVKSLEWRALHDAAVL